MMKKNGGRKSRWTVPLNIKILLVHYLKRVILIIDFGSLSQAKIDPSYCTYIYYSVLRLSEKFGFQRYLW